MKSIRVMNSPARICALIALCLALGACSEDKCPPPDDNSARGSDKLQAVSASCVARADEFHACALAALESFELSEAERLSLSVCSYHRAVPDSATTDVFAEARAAVVTHCVSF